MSKTYAQVAKEAVASIAAAETTDKQQLQEAEPEATSNAESSSDGDIDSESGVTSSAAGTVSEIARGFDEMVIGSTVDGTSESGAQASGLRGGSAGVGEAGPSNTGGGGGSDGDREPGGQGNWGHGKGQSWTDAQDLEVLRIYGANLHWTHRQVAAEFNRRFPNDLARTNDAVRQRRDRLRNQGETVASLQAKITAAGQGSGTG